jgi:hypothetical protein
MARTAILLGVAAGFLLPVLAGRASAAGEKGDPAPEEVLKKVQAAAQSGDVDGFLANLAQEPRKTWLASAAAHDGLTQARKSFEEALDEKFGKDPDYQPWPVTDMKRDLARLRKLELLGQEAKGDGKIEIKVRTTYRGPEGADKAEDQTMALVKEGGTWKLVPPRLDPERVNRVLKTLAQRKAAAEEITRKVRDGTYKDRAEAQFALRRAEKGGG